MKLSKGIALAVVALVSTQVLADGGRMGGMASGGSGYANNRAIVVKQTGGGPAFDHAAYGLVLDVVKDLLAAHQLKWLRDVPTQQQSAESFCVEFKDAASSHDLIVAKESFEAVIPELGKVTATYALHCY